MAYMDETFEVRCPAMLFMTLGHASYLTVPLCAHDWPKT